MDTANITKNNYIIVNTSLVSKAIYMLTELFEEGEPLKDSLRRASLAYLESETDENKQKLICLIELGKEISIISETNAKLLLKAISYIKKKESKKDINKDANNDINLENIFSSSNLNTSMQIEGSVKEKENDLLESINIKSVHNNQIIETNTETKEKEQIHKDSEIKKDKSPMIQNMDIGTRRKKILEIVKTKGQATIHEFIQSVPGCSSKTIQRELTSLVLSGTLKKTGERRWSIYSLR